MAIREDPEGVELKTVLKHATFTHKEVVEVGCGDGRLTFKFADMAKSVVALDPVAGDISKATESMPKEILSRLDFLIGTGEKLPFSDASFDVVFFTWSLCAMSSEAHMKEALDEAWRVLRPKGLVLNLQPSLQQPFHWGDVTYLVTKNPAHLVDGDVGMDAFNSRYAIKRAALIEEKFGLTAEEEFTGNIYFDTVEEAVDAINQPWKNEYERLDYGTKREIHRRLRSRHTPEGVRVQVNGVLTVLRKLQPG